MSLDIPCDAPARFEEARVRDATEALLSALSRATWTWCLAHCIVVAGALCAAREGGFDTGVGQRPPFWTPGCGRRGGYRQPNLYPCGCSKHKVNLGRCDQYKPGEMP